MDAVADWPHFIIQSVPDGIITVDGQMQITDLNRAAENLTGYSRDEAMGRYCGEILQSSLCGKECPLRTAMGTGEVVTREAVLQNRRNEKLEVMLAAAALRDDQGTLLGGVETFRDVGPLKLLDPGLLLHPERQRHQRPHPGRGWRRGLQQLPHHP
jgi:two-component system phosphate regulon sensor histidine kinase PhoR